MISYDITADKWCIGNETLAADELAEKYGIWNPIIYCQERREELRQLKRRNQVPNEIITADEFCLRISEDVKTARRIALLETLLEHAVKEADGWHDESRGGPIEGDPLIDEAKELLGMDSATQD